MSKVKFLANFQNNLQEKQMITQEQLDADLTAVTAAQKVLDADKAAFDALQPHLSVLAEIESYVDSISQEAKDGFLGVVAKARALF